MQIPDPAARDFPSDARVLSLPERQTWHQRLGHQNAHWLRRLQHLCEVRLQPDFPAFLLATPPFAQLARGLAAAARRRELDTAIAEDLDRFVDAYRDYVRTCAGEDAFGAPVRRAC